MFLEPPITLIPRPPSQPQLRSYEQNGADNSDNDDNGVKFNPPASGFGSSSGRSISTSSEGDGSNGGCRRPRGSMDSGSADQQAEATDHGDHATRSEVIFFFLTKQRSMHDLEPRLRSGILNQSSQGLI